MEKKDELDSSASPNEDSGKILKDLPSNLLHKYKVALIWLVGLCIFSAALILEYEKENMQFKAAQMLITVLFTLGATIVATGAATVLFERFQRNRLLEVMGTSFEETINKKMPEKYANLRNAGVSDAYMGFKVDRFCERLNELEDTEIRILKMWIPNSHKLRPALLKAIVDGGCTLKIVLLDKEKSEAAIEKRAKSIGRTHPNYINVQIDQNLLLLERLYSEVVAVIGREEAAKKVQVKLNDSFIGASMIGYGERMYVGLYLREMIATDGMIIKVQGVSNSHFKEALRHFNKEFECANEYVLGEKELAEETD